MKIRNIIAIFLAIFLISSANRESDNRLAAASEEASHICDHSACEEALEEAQRSFDLILRIEIEFVPGIFDDWAVISFNSAPIEINQAACDSLEAGMDICESIASDIPFIENIIDCRIIVAEMIPNE